MNVDGVHGKVESLMRFRNALDENEKELFDVLIQYAREVAVSVERSAVPARGAF